MGCKSVSEGLGVNLSSMCVYQHRFSRPVGSTRTLSWLVPGLERWFTLDQSAYYGHQVRQDDKSGHGLLRTNGLLHFVEFGKAVVKRASYGHVFR